MIHKVHIQNFKCLRDVSVELERFTVFVGANGSGKTSVLEAIDNAVRAYTGERLASVLAYMLLNDPQGFENLVAVARTLIPRLLRIRFRKATVHRTENELVRFGNDTVSRRSRRPYQGELILFDFEHAENV